MSIHRFSLTWMGTEINYVALDRFVLISPNSLPSSTLIDSTPGVLVAWDSFGREYGFDGAAAAHDGHGRRLAESLVEKCKLETPEQVAVRPQHYTNPLPLWGTTHTPAMCCRVLFLQTQIRPLSCVLRRLSSKADRSRSQVHKRYSHRSTRAVRRRPAGGPS
jgi:hypothetical protein